MSYGVLFEALKRTFRSEFDIFTLRRSNPAIADYSSDFSRNRALSKPMSFVPHSYLFSAVTNLALPAELYDPKIWTAA